VLRYVVSRLLSVFPVLFFISVFVFSVMHLLPGDPAMLILQGEYATRPEDIARLRQELGLNDPIHVQYGRFLAGALVGNLGRSVHFKRPVVGIIVERLPKTAALTGFALIRVSSRRLKGWWPRRKPPVKLRIP